MGKLPFLDFLEMTINETEVYIEGIALHRETNLNDLLYASFDLSRLIPLSVWSPDKLPNKPTRLDSAQTSKKKAYSNKPQPMSADDLTEQERQDIINSLAQQQLSNYKELSSIIDTEVQV